MLERRKKFFTHKKEITEIYKIILNNVDEYGTEYTCLLTRQV